MAFIDLFSDNAALYASARPHYPAALFDFIASIAPAARSVWDCATGNGQAAVSLARHFDAVYATDPSSEQIANAVPCKGVEYSIQQAESTSFANASFDAVCVAQALHWFDLPTFFREAQRVMKPHGVFAAWGYAWFTVSPEFDAVFKCHILDVIAADWAPQNALLWRAYKDVNMPFDSILAPTLRIEESWTLHQLLAYVHSWSATRRCIARNGAAFFNQAELRLSQCWGAPDSRETVFMPIHLLVGANNNRGSKS